MKRKEIRSNNLVFLKIIGNKSEPMLRDIFCYPATLVPRTKGKRVQECVLSLNVGRKTFLSKKFTLERNG